MTREPLPRPKDRSANEQIPKRASAYASCHSKEDECDERPPLLRCHERPRNPEVIVGTRGLGKAALANGRMAAAQPVSLRQRVTFFSPTPYFSASWRLVFVRAWSVKSAGQAIGIGENANTKVIEVFQHREDKREQHGHQCCPYHGC